MLPEQFKSFKKESAPAKESAATSAKESATTSTTTSTTTPVTIPATTTPATAEPADLEKSSLLEPAENPVWKQLKVHVRREVEYYKEEKWYWKIVYWLEAPLTVLRNATIPVVMEERYNKFNLLLTAFGMPLFLFYKSGKALTDPICGMPAWLLLLIVIPALFIFFYLTTPWTQPPTGWVFFLILFVAFFMSIMWVEEIADELVSLMNALGCIAGIQPFVMGLTILAVGNSISDLIGDVTITKQGYPQMAIGGIYASPMFSLLVGLGIALSIKYIEDP